MCIFFYQRREVKNHVDNARYFVNLDVLCLSLLKKGAGINWEYIHAMDYMKIVSILVYFFMLFDINYGSYYL